MAESIHKVSKLRSLLGTASLLTAPDKLLSKHLRAGDGLFQTYVGSDPVIFTDRLEIFEKVLRIDSRSFKKSTLSQKVIRQYLGDGLVSLEGAEWQRHRLALNGGFDRKHIEIMADKVGDEVSSSIEAWKDTKRLDWHAAARDLTLRTIAKLLFSHEFGPDEQKILEHLVHKSLLVGTLEARSEMAAVLLRHSGIKPRLMSDLSNLKQTWLDRVRDRRASEKPASDLLGWLLDAEPKGGNFDEEDIIAELATFFFAGHDTTTTTLAWMGHEMSQRSDLQARIRSEIRERCRDEAITFSCLLELPLLRATIMEVLRLHPPAWVIDRESVGTRKIGSIEVRGGTSIILCIKSMQRNGKYWSNPTTFDESRFMDRKPGSAWMPFGSGPRQCIGRHLAMMQVQMAFAYLLRDYEIRAMSHSSPRKRYSLTMQMKSRLPIELIEV